MERVIWTLMGVLLINSAFADQSAPQTTESIILFLVDSSGSMHGNDTNGLRFQAIGDFVSLGSEDTYFVLMSFDSEARCHYNGAVRTAEQRERFDVALSNLGTGGKQTSLDAGFRGALVELQKCPHTEGAVILLTDAIDTGTYHNSHRSLSARGVRIFSIGLGQANTGVLEAISRESGGDCFTASNAQDLLAVYRKMSSKVLRRAILLTRDLININHDEQFVGEWYLEEGASAMCVSVEKVAAEDSPILVIPGNRQIIFSEDRAFPGVTINGTERWSALMMQAPPPGHYQLIVKADDQGSISVLADVNSPIRVCVDSERPYYRHGESAVLNLAVDGDVYLDTVGLSIHAPGGQTHGLSVSINGDVAETQYFMPSETGSYFVTVDVAGVDHAQGSFTRQASCSFEVLAHPTTFQVPSLSELIIEPRYPDSVNFSAKIIGKGGAKGAVSFIEALPSDPVPEGFSLSAQRVALRPGSSSGMEFSMDIPRDLAPGRYSFDLIFRASHSQEVITSPFTLVAKRVPPGKRAVRIAIWCSVTGVIATIVIWSVFIALREEESD